MPGFSATSACLFIIFTGFKIPPCKRIYEDRVLAQVVSYPRMDRQRNTSRGCSSHSRLVWLE